MSSVWIEQERESERRSQIAVCSARTEIVEYDLPPRGDGGKETRPPPMFIGTAGCVRYVIPMETAPQALDHMQQCSALKLEITALGKF